MDNNDLITKAIDAIIKVVENYDNADAHYFIHSENSVVSKLRRLEY